MGIVFSRRGSSKNAIQKLAEKALYEVLKKEIP